MKCPRCPGSLSPQKYEQITIDRCSACGGTWLDHAELDKVQIHWEHWEKQRKEKSGAWGQAARAEARNAAKDADQARTAMQKNLGVISGTLDRVFHALEKSRRQGG